MLETACTRRARRWRRGPAWPALRWRRFMTRTSASCWAARWCRVPDGGSIAGAIDYSLIGWSALTRHLEDGAVPIDNNFIERQINPWAMGRKAWLFCGSELAGQRAAIVMSLVQSAKLNGHDPWAYLRDVLERLPSHPNSRIDQLLPHRWNNANA